MPPAASAKVPVTVRIENAKRLALDELAARLGRDRSSLINEALDAYLAAQPWQLDRIAGGLRRADAGEFDDPDSSEGAHGVSFSWFLKCDFGILDQRLRRCRCRTRISSDNSAPHAEEAAKRPSRSMGRASWRILRDAAFRGSSG